ncbi:thiamine pyrophosphate-dependent dehydrogenase E1 component subunit alpha [Agrobacterium sp. OT33]|uniref:thiamine pyrophosphate-dependent dehydrogenase E1 component subunit alpha n=1 Tax=Agrobacterium sp. OT33 TaxID=2815338 RepID=UPI001A8DCB6E|nr:thiamine pyrophosphate-dependent dehydrogenase E1 component subunit alpha [Agrobacterium sp. OT33]MBO0128516.1 thiamine pyrophosphate-dependent dehydrogenase E1 component subunit alpha [Agrobacterium sp. OT33]
MTRRNEPVEALKAIYKRALMIRHAEKTLQVLFADGKVPGFLHLSIGQEAVASSISEWLREGDTVSSNHRGHGHTLAKGVDLEGFFAEILGRATGICGGRGGSMHVADLRLGMLGANGIVGAGLPITTGSALALKIKGQGDIAVVYFGDGALAEGLVHECLNIAKLWSLPILFVCENNGWSEFSPTHKQMAVKLADLAQAFGIGYLAADGNDIVAVHEAAGEAIGRVRRETIPFILECRTTRIRGHYEGDKQDYRPDGEAEEMAGRDPLAIAVQRLTELGVEVGWISDTQAQVEAENARALDAAMGAPMPDPSSLLDDVYTPEALSHG